MAEAFKDDGRLGAFGALAEALVWDAAASGEQGQTRECIIPVGQGSGGERLGCRATGEVAGGPRPLKIKSSDAPIAVEDLAHQKEVGGVA